MAKITVEEQKEFTLLPPDSILLLKVDECTTKEQQGRNGPWIKLEVKFKVLGIQAIGDGSDPRDYEAIIGGPIWGSVPFKITDSPENKLNLWTSAILGLEPTVGYELDTDHFLNREVRGLTSQYDKRSTDPRTGLPFKGHQIDSLLPKGPGPQFQQAPPQYAAQQQQPPAQPQYQQPAPVQDPWGTPAQDPWGTPNSDEPPF